MEATRLRARIGGLARSAQYDGAEMTAAARSAFRDRFLTQVDPDGRLPEVERLRRAEAARKLFYAQLALKSAKVRARARSREP